MIQAPFQDVPSSKERKIAMALRFASKNMLITGTVVVPFTHGLGATPDEYFFVNHGASDAQLAVTAPPDFTAVWVSAGPGGATLSVFAAVNHTIIR
jgi:hypothetical protein